MKTWIVLLLTAVAGAKSASAQSLDVTVFTGLAYPLYDERLTLRPGGPSIPGVDVTVAEAPVLRGDGGAVFGAAVGLEFGLVALEGRIDSIDAGIDFSGARYDLRGNAFPLQGLSASLIAEAGRFDADRISVLSINARLRTPGPLALVASGGVSYLPDLSVSGSVPLNVLSPDLPPFGFAAGLTLRGTPGQSEHRLGLNGGAGVRLGSGRLALIAEVRGFYFREYELRFGTADGPPLLDELLDQADAIRFEPVFVNAQAGLSFRF